MVGNRRTIVVFWRFVLLFVVIILISGSSSRIQLMKVMSIMDALEAVALGS